MKVLLSLLLFLFFSPGEIYSQDNTGEITTFILVRHAEKADDSANPDLSSEGYERAHLLDRMLAEIKFDAVYTTPFLRTKETAMEIAKKNNLNIIEYDPNNPDILAAEWREKHQGKEVLIAGHSNTTPLFANALLGREHFKEKFDEMDFGNILIVTISSGGDSNLLHMRYEI